MISKLAVLILIGLIVNFFGLVVGAHYYLDPESIQFAQTEMIIWFFVIYLPLILITIILDAKKAINVKSFFKNKYRLGLFVFVILISFVLGFNDIGISLNKFIYWLMY